MNVGDFRSMLEPLAEDEELVIVEEDGKTHEVTGIDTITFVDQNLVIIKFSDEVME